MANYNDDKLDKMYKQLPKINCKQLCEASCSIIPIGDLERKRIEKWLGFNPFLTPEQIIEDLKSKSPCQFTCSLLKEGKCSIYRIRPLICRLFGLTKKMQCPFGCVPDKWMDDKVAREMLKKAKY